jgi:F420-dependent oxidoreductase-like protein
MRVDRQIQLLTEFLTALRPYLETGEVDVAGEQLTARTPFPSALPGATPPPILVAAMGPNAPRVTGELADGTITYLAGPRALAEHVVPTLSEAAASAGRPEPRIVAAIPAVVTDDPDAARAVAYRQRAFYEGVPSYRAVLDREGVARAGDLAVIGGAEQVTDQLHRYLEAGATEVTVTQTDLAGPDDRLRTWELVGRLAREG